MSEGTSKAIVTGVAIKAGTMLQIQCPCCDKPIAVYAAPGPSEMVEIRCCICDKDFLIRRVV